jgi:hypothetical protein
LEFLLNNNEAQRGGEMAYLRNESHTEISTWNEACAVLRDVKNIKHQ